MTVEITGRTLTRDALVRVARRGEAVELSREAVDRMAAAAHELLDSLVTNAPPRDREVEARKARIRAAERFGVPAAGRA